jgi:hypothetical protein
MVENGPVMDTTVSSDFGFVVDDDIIGYERTQKELLLQLFWKLKIFF